MTQLVLTPDQNNKLYEGFTESTHYTGYDTSKFIDYMFEITHNATIKNLFLPSPTVIEFENESDKNLFILKYL